MILPLLAALLFRFSRFYDVKFKHMTKKWACNEQN
jgi:hypothetical protein